jgi:hypothetical protein
MNLSPYKIPAICALGGLVGGFFICKYTLPPRTVTKIETKIETVEVEKWRDRIVKEQGPVRETTRTVTVPGPAGPTVTVDRIVEREKVVTKTVNSGQHDTVIVEREKSSVTVDNRPWIAVEGSLGLGSEARIAYSAGAQVRVLGPIWLGAGFIKADTWYVGPSARIEF